MTDWLADRLTDWLIDWLADWLTDWLTDNWLTDNWLHAKKYFWKILGIQAVKKFATFYGNRN